MSIIYSFDMVTHYIYISNNPNSEVFVVYSNISDSMCSFWQRFIFRKTIPVMEHVLRFHQPKRS